jgi:hypothetical protein
MKTAVRCNRGRSTAVSAVMGVSLGSSLTAYAWPTPPVHRPIEPLGYFLREKRQAGDWREEAEE